MGYLNQGKTTISVFILSFLALLLLFNSVNADKLFDVFINNTFSASAVHPSNPAGDRINNSFLNGTVIFNLTIIANDTWTGGQGITLGPSANATNVTLMFTRIQDNRIFSFAKHGNFTNQLGIGARTFVNISVDTLSLPDGRYNLSINITNATQIITVTTNTNVTSTNLTVDNFAPAINQSVNSVSNNTYFLPTVHGALINVTVNETSPENVTVRVSNSTSVNETVFQNYFRYNGTSGGLTLSAINDALTLRNFSFNISLDEHDNDEKIWFNVTVFDQYDRQNTSPTFFVIKDGAVPCGISAFSVGSTARHET